MKTSNGHAPVNRRLVSAVMSALGQRGGNRRTQKQKQAALKNLRKAIAARRRLALAH